MTIALWCVLLAGLLPYVGTTIAKWGFRQYDNNNPRDWLARQSGVRARGNAAQANGFEAFPLFAAAVIIATMLKANQTTLDILAMVFVAARVAYIVCYVSDRATLRSLFWFIGITCVVAIFLSARS